MTEETKPAAEQTLAPSEPQTLDDVYKQFNVDEAVKEFQQTPAQPQKEAQKEPQHPTPNIPDPVLDQNGFRQYIAQNAHESQNLRQTLQELKGTLTNMQIAALRNREEADIKQAIEAVNSNLDTKLDPDAIEIGLGIKARKDPKFLAVYQNRYKNPQAWNAALKVVSKELGSKFAMRTDPKIAENVRALKEATSGKATTDQLPASTTVEQMQKAQGAEFDRMWARLRGGRA